jgi:hypothetical protein
MLCVRFEEALQLVDEVRITRIQFVRQDAKPIQYHDLKVEPARPQLSPLQLPQPTVLEPGPIIKF